MVTAHFRERSVHFRERSVHFRERSIKTHLAGGVKVDEGFAVTAVVSEVEERHQRQGVVHGSQSHLKDFFRV